MPRADWLTDNKIVVFNASQLSRFACDTTTVAMMADTKAIP